MSKESALIEAILLLENDPVNINFISRISALDKGIVKISINELKDKYSSEDFGIEIVEISDGYMLSPKQEFWGHLKDHYGKKNDEKLSKAGMETLSIIAYSQPLTRAEIENIRGVSVDGIMRQLIKRNLVQEVGKKEIAGKPPLYGTTKEFLRLFRLKSIADLPRLDEVNQDRFELNG